MSTESAITRTNPIPSSAIKVTGLALRKCWRMAAQRRMPFTRIVNGTPLIRVDIYANGINVSILSIRSQD